MTQKEELELLQYTDVSKITTTVLFIMGKVFFNVNSKDDNKPPYSKKFEELTKSEWGIIPNFYWIDILIKRPEWTEKCDIWEFFTPREKAIILKYRKDLTYKFIENESH
jgi:hypothetical protein